MAIPLYLVDDPTLQFNFDLIAQALVDTGGRSIRLHFGLVNLTFGGGTTTGVVVVPHGFANDPVAVIPGVYNTGSSFATGTRVATWKSSATEFSIQGERAAADAPNGTVVRAAWVAIG